MVLGEGIVQRFLTNTLSAYFENVDADNLSVAVVRGDVSLSQVQLRKSVMKHLGFNSLRLVSGSVGSLKAQVPWTKFGAAPIVFELENLYVLVESDEDEDGMKTPSEIEARMKESMEEITQVISSTESDAATTQSNSWGSWLRSAGRLAKRLIDYIEIQIRIKNVHVRYSADLFSAGATFDSLCVTTTTQQSAPKILALEKLAFYCNPLQDAVEEEEAPKNSLSSSPNGYQYVLEPVSGSVDLSFPSSSEISIRGQFDSVQLQFNRDQLNTSIWAELKRILMSTGTAHPTAPQPESPRSPRGNTKIRVSFALGKAVVKSICLPPTASTNGSVDFVGEELQVSGEIGAESEVKFRMRTMNIVNENRRILTSRISEEMDFIQISVRTNDDSLTSEAKVDVQFRLGPVVFDFYPIVVGSLLSFLKSFPTSGDQSTSTSKKGGGRVHLQFYWESMDVNWYQVISERLFAKSSMSASFISLELLPTKEFIARGELGDFSIDHIVDETIAKPILSLANPKSVAGYLFKFFVRSFDDSLPEFPGYYTQVEFDLSAVRLVVVRASLVRFWNFIFDGFIPGITGELTAGDRVRPSQGGIPGEYTAEGGIEDDEDFKSVSSDGVDRVRSFVFSPKIATGPVADNQRRPYLLSVSLDALELVVPVSATAEETDPLWIELHKMTIRNRGSEGEVDIIDFDLEEVKFKCLGRELASGIRVETVMHRESPTMRIVTKFGSEIALNLDRYQYCRLCQVLDHNILGNASDGVLEDSAASSIGNDEPPAAASGEWLKFEFDFPLIQLAIDDANASRISIDNLGLRIVKFREAKSKIVVDLMSVALQGQVGAMGGIPSVSVEVESETIGRSILVTIQEPSLEVNLGIFWDLRAYFFDNFFPYTSPTGIRPSLEICPPPSRWETVLNVNLMHPKLVVPARNDTAFSVGANVLSYNQNWISSEERLTRKIVISNGSLGHQDSLIASQVDLFYSIAIDPTGEIVKLNCQPVDVGLSFSQLKEIQKAVDRQMKTLPDSTNQVQQAETTTNISPKIRRQTDISLSSVSLLVVNDFAVLQNTPLFNLTIRNFETAISVIASPGESNESVCVIRESFSVLLEVAIAYFNKTSVAWEPLVEARTGSGDSRFIKLNARKSCISFGGGEKSSQIAFEVSEGGIQLNITEALVQSGFENYQHWIARDSRVVHSVADIKDDNVVVFSPYSVCNMTGEPEIFIQSQDLTFRVGNGKEEPLPGVAVQVDDGSLTVSHRVFAKIEAPNLWSLVRVPLDKIGVSLFNIGGGADLVSRVSVTRDGRKILTLESSVLIHNRFGSDVLIKLSNMDELGYEVTIPSGESAPIPSSAVEHGHFRISLSGTQWSGSVSLADVRARNESKLWQIKLENTLFLYLSGKKIPVAFRDREINQLVISVFTPVRLRSTLPVLADYQIVTKSTSGVGGYASAGTIGLNGLDNISSVPLTGRLELSLSIYDGRCITREPIQIWPAPTEDLEQDVSTKDFFLPIELISPTSNTTVLELRLLYDESVSLVRPPELTLHTGQWLVCVDVPQQLRFVYADGLDDWAAALGAMEPVTIETPHGEKSYAAPLHARAKSVSAYLNKTRSESVLVDTIGSSSQITLDAFDEASKTRVKQDLAVRVSSVQSGVVRDLPVRITTVCPKYIIVNMLDEAINVRQMGNVASQGIAAGPGDQVAFRWWTVTSSPEDGRDIVNRSLQIRLASQPDWSERIKVSEIGESLVRGISSIRSEVRIYHGGFFIVLSNTQLSSHEESNISKFNTVVSNEVYQLILPELSVSVTGPVASRNVRRAELMLLDIKSLLLTVSLTPVANELDLRMGALQVDDLRDEAKFPVVFGKAIPPKRSSASSTPPPESASAAEVLAAWVPPGKGDTVLNFESFLIRSADSNLCIDFSLVSDLTAMFLASAGTDESSVSSYPFKYQPVMEKLPVGSLRIWSFKEFLLGSMKVNLSFNPGAGGLGGSNYSVFHRAIASMAAVERSPIAFQALALTKFRASRSNVVSVITEHYKYELYREMRTIMGSAEAFGNPVGLMNSVSIGVSDLFHEPLSAIREMQGPEDMALVADKAATGAKSFFRNTAFGVANTFSKLAATSAQTLSILAEDDEFLAERKDFNSKNRPSHFGDGVMVGAASFGRGVLSGLSGLVTKPVEGLEQDGLSGFAKGAFKGFGGFFLKPMAGFLDFAKSTADGVVSSTKDATLDSNHVRLPRMLYSHDRSIRVINSEHSLLRWYLSQLENMPLNFSYCSHVYDSQNGLLIASSSDHLVAADTNLRRLTLLVPLWRVVGVTTDLDHLVLSINVRVASSEGTSRIDLELSSVAIIKSVQQLLGNSMEW